MSLPSLRPDDVLLLIDIQNDFCPGGALAVPDGDAVVPLANRLARRFQAVGASVVLTQDWHPPGHSGFASVHPGARPFDTILLPYGPQTVWPDHCVQNTPGAAFHPRLEAGPGARVQRKGANPAIDSYSAFFENDKVTPTGLGDILREKGVRRVFVAGLATDFCVAHTAIDAARLGLEAYIVEDACRAIDLNGSLAAARAAWTAAGVRTLTLRDPGL